MDKQEKSASFYNYGTVNVLPCPLCQLRAYQAFARALGKEEFPLQSLPERIEHTLAHTLFMKLHLFEAEAALSFRIVRTTSLSC